MKTNSKSIIYLVLVSFMSVTCSPDDPPPLLKPVAPSIGAPLLDSPWDFEEGVYIAGSGVTSDRFVAKVWGNGNTQLLNHGQYGSTATSIFLYGDDLYVVGYEDNWLSGCSFPPCPTNAMIWKNGIAQPLTEMDLNSRALSVFVSNDDVYIAGDKRTSIGHGIATLWINGTAHALNDGKFSASANSVFVSNGDIYVAGYEDDLEGSKAKLWKNGVSETLTGGSNATSVFVVGADVYVAGDGSAGAILWRNGVEETLSNSAISSSVYASVYATGEDVYVAGSEYANIGDGQYAAKAMVWKNGEPISLAGDHPYTLANSISVSKGGDVYVVGQKGDIPIVWKNGIAKSLGQGIATALFIR
jgi:hypothetical protein